jgi:putative hydrolase of the HAD superfamily
VWKDSVYEQLRSQFGSVSWPSTDLLVQSYLHEFPGTAVEMNGASTLLKLLRRRGVRTAIVTNGRSDLQRAVIEALGFDALVDAVVISEEVGFRKPQPQIFHVALEALACHADEAIMVGDDPIADLEGARAAGIQPIAFRCKASESTPLVTDMEGAGDEILSRLGRAA